VLKGASIGELHNAIVQVLAGETYVSPSLAAKLIERLRKPANTRNTRELNFSKREEDVLRELMNGRTNKEIAIALSISDKTVKHYMTVLIQKLEVRNRVEVVIAVRELVSKGALASSRR
jgi:two-component system, NarL family, nitrate/nitrite response regulator NarL